ncbi:hypothetical protein C7C45_28585 [Micromonospora arborensis]|uniref:Uncharacterized protein n=1 Tax=Micromonospora arborensis TaxID=2116518 RepID=A0A318NM39_9ACTN|nr:hypothetical protein C7C45_28585 [Micromonospora arborensis]
MRRVGSAEKFSNAEAQLTVQIVAQGAHRVVVLGGHPVLRGRGSLPQTGERVEQAVGQAGLITLQAWSTAVGSTHSRLSDWLKRPCLEPK